MLFYIHTYIHTYIDGCDGLVLDFMVSGLGLPMGVYAILGIQTK